MRTDRGADRVRRLRIAGRALWWVGLFCLVPPLIAAWVDVRSVMRAFAASPHVSHPVLRRRLGVLPGCCSSERFRCCCPVCFAWSCTVRAVRTGPMPRQRKARARPVRGRRRCVVRRRASDARLSLSQVYCAAFCYHCSRQMGTCSILHLCSSGHLYSIQRMCTWPFTRWRRRRVFACSFFAKAVVECVALLGRSAFRGCWAPVSCARRPALQLFTRFMFMSAGGFQPEGKMCTAPCITRRRRMRWPVGTGVCI